MDAVEHWIAEIQMPKQFEAVKQVGKRVTVRQKETMSTSERGHILLEFERILRLYGPYEIFLEPRGDVNKLRLKLRGVKV